MAVVYAPEVMVADRRHYTVDRHNHAVDRRHGDGAVDRQHVTNSIAAFGPNPLVGMAAFAFSVPLRHVYAMFWRAGLMEIVE